MAANRDYRTRECAEMIFTTFLGRAIRSKDARKQQLLMENAL